MSERDAPRKAVRGQAVTPAVSAPAKRSGRGTASAPAAATAVAPTTAAEREELIRLTAYQLYENNGCRPGHALEDWIAAEALVDARARLAADAQRQPRHALRPEGSDAPATEATAPPPARRATRAGRAGRPRATGST